MITRKGSDCCNDWRNVVKELWAKYQNTIRKIRVNGQVFDPDGDGLADLGTIGGDTANALVNLGSAGMSQGDTFTRYIWGVRSDPTDVTSSMVASVTVNTLGQSSHNAISQKAATDALSSKADINDIPTIPTTSGTDAYTADNPVTLQDFVNSSIATNTANYISDNGQPFTSASQLPTTGVTNNDYAFVTGTDAAGNTYYDRYKATVDANDNATWALEYRLNNSSFTVQQWNAITSGITSGLVAQFNGYAAQIAAKADPVDTTGANEGDVLTLDSNLLPTWQAPSGGGGGGGVTPHSYNSWSNLANDALAHPNAFCLVLNNGSNIFALALIFGSSNSVSIHPIQGYYYSYDQDFRIDSYRGLNISNIYSATATIVRRGWTFNSAGGITVGNETSTTLNVSNVRLYY